VVRGGKTRGVRTDLDDYKADPGCLVGCVEAHLRFACDAGARLYGLGLP
jgi:hypothetical protein